MSAVERRSIPATDAFGDNDISDIGGDSSSCDDSEEFGWS
jgi:hypothetical protein